MACDSDSADEEFYDAIEDVAHGGVSNRRLPCTAASGTLVADEKPGLHLLKTDAGSKSQDKAKENEKTCNSIDITNADSEPGSRRTCPTRSQEDGSVVSVAASGSLIEPEEILSLKELDAAKNEKVFYENDIAKAEDVSVKGSEAIKMKLCSADQAESSAGSSKAEVVNVPSRQGKYAPFDDQEVQVFKEDLKETKHPKECQEPGKKEMPAKPPPPLIIEPDIVTSTKQGLPQRPPGPGNGPPRRPPPPRPSMLPSVARKQLLSDSKSASLEVSKEPNLLSGLVSPNTAVENLAQELCSLDLASLSASDQVVVAQEQEDCTVEPALRNSAPPVSGRPRSDSGRELTDEEILALVMVKNLDTGEEIPLSQAEDKLPCGINPLSLHIMQRTQEFLSQDVGSDEEEKLSQGQEMDGRKLKQKTVQFRKFLGKSMRKARVLAEEYGERAVSKVRSVRDEVLHADEDASSEEDEGTPYTRPVKFKAAHGTRGPSDFEQIALVQDLSHEHKGAVWTMKFSHCGRLLATAGQDNVVRIWVLKISLEFFSNMRQKYSSDGRVSPSPSQDSISSFKSETEVEEPEVDTAAPFRQKPFCKYSGHTADLLDLSWSKNYFLLSSSMDKTVRLWHISRRECLCCFQHVDFVTAIAFHPRDDRYFLSGSLDGKLRLWNIPEKKVALWNEVDGSTKLITAANFCQNGRFAVIGTYDGRCIFYETEHLKYFTQIHVRSTRGRNRVGRKITGIEPFSAESKVLVTSNDSRIRLYDLRDLSLSIKYKGCLNNSSQIRAGFSHDCQYIISGSEDRYIYLWKTYHDVNRFSSVRRDRNDFWEGIKAHNAVVTSAIFSPNPSLILDAEGQSGGEEKKPEEVDTQKVLNEEQLQGDESQDSKDGEAGDFLVTADFTGAIKVFVNRRKKPNAVPEVSAQ